MAKTAQSEHPGLTHPLLISLPGIAELARVQRPVVSMWRARFATGARAFPAPVARVDGLERFDAAEVGRWLSDTTHGNNPDATVDAAAFAVVEGLDVNDPRQWHAACALLALRTADGLSLAGSSADELFARATAVDPDDSSLVREIQELQAPEAVAAYIDAIVDAAYSPADAFARLDARRTAHDAADGVAGPLSPDAVDLVARLALQMADASAAEFADSVGTGTGHELLTAIAIAASEESDVVAHLAPADSASRDTRRVLALHGLGHIVDATGDAGAGVVHISRVTARDAVSDLAKLEELVVELSARQRAIVVGPAWLLTEPLTPELDGPRDYLLRSGRVRGIARLPQGLVPSAPRLALAMWVIGGEQQDESIAERFAVVADLEAIELTPAARADLVSDLVAALGGSREVRGHAFRFGRFVRTSSLLAADDSLVAAARVARAVNQPRGAHLQARIDETIARLGRSSPLASDRLIVPTAPQPGADAENLPSATLGELVASRVARVLPGARLAAADLTVTSGFVVISRPELGAERPQARHIDRLAFASRYPRAHLTQPGDIVFVAGSNPQAWVDALGSSVVEYPARILRVETGAGLVPEVVAADIRATPPGLPWRRWLTRRVPPSQADALGGALADISTARDQALARAADLDRLAELVSAGVAAGAVALSKTELAASTEGTT